MRTTSFPMPFNLILLAAYTALMIYILPQWSKQPWPSDGTACTAPLGHPEKLTVDGVEYHFEYDDKGRIVRRSSDTKAYRVAYVWQHDYPVHVTLTYAATEQTAAASYEWRYIYDNHQNVVYASDLGDEAWFTYNDQGEMSSIESNLGSRIDLGYDAKCHDLNKITRSDGVTVDIALDARCEPIDDNETELTPTQYLMMNQLNTTLDLIRFTDVSLVPQAK